MEVRLRAWQSSDLDNLVKYANNQNVARNLMNRFPYPYSEADGKAFLVFAQSSGADQVFAIEVDGQAVGGISIEPQTDIHCKNAELGYWLAEPFWGQGIVSQAIRQVVYFAFTTFDIERIFARPFGTNPASHRVLEKNHFTLEGKFENVLYKNGQYMDELIYALRRGQWQEQDRKR